MDERYAPIAEKVVEATIAMDTYRQTWERALAIQGMLAVGIPDGVATARRWIDQGVRVQGSEGQLNYHDWVGLTEGHHIGRVYPNAIATAFGYAALDLADPDDADDPRLVAARRQARALLKGPRTSDGGLVLLHGSGQLWVDSLFLYCPLLARLSAIDGDDALADEVVRQFEVHHDHLHDPRTGLIRHNWCEQPDHFPQSAFWARGNGWFGLAVVDCARWLGAERMGGVIKAYRDHLEAACGYQDASGMWRNVIDDPRGRLESSGSLLFAYAIAKGVAQGLIDDALVPRATRALGAVVPAVSRDGLVRGTTVMPGGPGVSLGSTAFGQGLFLLALAALEDIDALEDPVW